MLTIKGNSKQDITASELDEILFGYRRVHLDLGAGDGRFTFKSAQNNAQDFYIALDPAEKQLKEYSRKAVRQKVENCIFVVGSAELLPAELTGRINNITILFPWGSLLKFVVEGNEQFLTNITKLLKDSETENRLTIVLGYSQDAEPTEVERLGLLNLNLNYIYAHLVPAFMRVGFKVDCIKELEKVDIKKYETTWGKRLSFGQDRPLFELTFIY